VLQDLVIIAPLAPMDVREQFDAGVGTVPLHLTVLPKVRVPSDRSGAVAAAVRDIAATTAPLTIVADGRAGFGQDGAVRVTTVVLSEELRLLHARLLEDVCNAGGSPAQPGYVGEGYRPHISDTFDGRLINPGEHVVLASLTILDCTEPIRQLTDAAMLTASGSRSV
jgi:hypothetical protein